MSLTGLFKTFAPLRLSIIIDGVSATAALAYVFIQKVATVECAASEVYLPLRVWLLPEIRTTCNLMAAHQQQLVVPVNALVVVALALHNSLHALVALLQSELMRQLVKRRPADTHNLHNHAVLGDRKSLGHPFLLLISQRVWV